MLKCLLYIKCVYKNVTRPETKKQKVNKLQNENKCFVKMVNKCSVIGCFTNYAGYDRGTVFKLPEDIQQRKQWIKFLNRQDHEVLKHVFICYKHFADNLIENTPKRVKLLHKLRPVPTKIPESQEIVNLPPTATLETIRTPRKPPKFRPFQEDELENFKKVDKITCLEDINEKKVNDLGQEFVMKRNDDNLAIYKLETNEVRIPEVTHCIRVDKDLHVKLFYKSVPLPLPLWFRQGRNTHLTSYSMLENFITYMKQEAEDHQGILTELTNLKYYKHPIYSARLIRYALELRYTSLQAYKILLEELPLPSVSYLRSLTAGECFHYFN